MKQKNILLVLLLVLFIILFFLPLPVYITHVLVLTFYYAYLGTAWNLMCGYSGRLSLGHASFTAIGAYITLLLYKNMGLTPWLGLLVGGILAVIVMTIIAYPCFRFGLKGPYFTLASIAVAEIVQNVLLSMRNITGGSLGLSLPYHPTSLTLLQFDSKKEYYLLIFILWLIAVGIVWRLERLRYYLAAIREDESAAAALGVSVTKNLVAAATLSAFLVALGGTFYAQYFRYIDPYSVAGFSMSLNMALVTIVGGTGTILGPTVGAFILIPLSEILRLSVGAKLAGLHLFVYGVLLIITIIFLPKGLTSIPNIFKDKWGKKVMN
ncbi:hypothetical protein MHLNE_22850 [Moorella humiferrea]|uniref:branched-chain amino acid ABC transporter permease n=1 Tax=Neomoorella humiferrea TaxID=676965 RepID=UPI0030CD72DC